MPQGRFRAEVVLTHLDLPDTLPPAPHELAMGWLVVQHWKIQ
jgi:hypothetical protein